jgi:predicted CXXCH cytochrome family protein
MISRRPRALVRRSTGRPWAAAALAAGALALSGCAGRGGPPAVEFDPIPENEAATVRNPHDVDGRPLCQRCHARGRAGLLSPPIALCVSCHPFGHHNHPVDVVQPVTPDGVPLLAGGKVACHSCHDPHDLKRNRAGLRYPYTDLCVRCHVKYAKGHRLQPQPD